MGLCILVADDSSTIQKVIKIALARYAVEIVSARSLSEAMTEASKHKVGAVLIDAGLPGAKEPNDFLSLRRQCGDSPFVILVGSYESFDDKAFIAAGLREIIRKPFESSSITKTLSRIVGKGFDGALLSTFGGSSVSTVLPGVPGAPTAVMPILPSPSPLRPLPNLIAPESPVPPQGSSVTPVPPRVPPPPAVSSSADSPPQPQASSLPPPPVLDEKRRGQKAFSLSETPEALGESSPPRDSPDMAREPVRGVPPPPPSVNIAPPPPRGRDAATQLPVAPTPSSASVSSSGGGGVPKVDLDQVFSDPRSIALMRETIQEFCEKNFPALAREVLTAELRRLADERARNLVDQ